MFNILRLAPALNSPRPSKAENDELVFSSLRTSLTASSILKMLALVALSAGVVYGLSAYYLSYVTDKSLLETMALEHESLGLALPSDLNQLEQAWHPLGQFEESYDEEDAVEWVSLMDSQGRPLENANPGKLHLGDWNLRDQSALFAARDTGPDFRSVYVDNSLHVRLYTRALPAGTPAAYIQLGRLLTEEDRIKHRLLLALFVSGTLVTVASGAISWWLTGRSLRSTQFLWDQQQTFVANASHELRTPLTLIRASAQVLQLSLDKANPQWQLLDDVLNETDYMSRLVDDMLVLSRLDAGQLKLDLMPVDLALVLPKLARSFASLAGEKGVRVCVAGAEGIVQVDPTRFWQVLLILLDNSLRHTPAGGTITLESMLCDAGVRITITDTGRGIPPADLPRVFERFYKASNSHSDKRSAGLGLSIAKPLVELHKGEIKIQSTPNVRTMVTITLPSHELDSTLGIPSPDMNH